MGSESARILHRPAVGRGGTAALVQPIDQIAFEDASPARREFNEGRSFADRDQTLQCSAREAGDRGGFVIAVDEEPVFPRPPCDVTPCQSSQSCKIGTSCVSF